MHIFNKILSFIIGNKSLVLLHSDFIVRIELNNEYAISFYEIANINRAFWAKKEETLAVLTYSGLYIISINDFSYENEKKCFTGKKNLFYSACHVFVDFRILIGKIISVIKPLLFPSRLLSYQIILCNSDFEGLYFNEDKKDYASLIAFAGDGKSAVAYESKDVIVVFNENKKQKLIIDKLKLALNNNILIDSRNNDFSESLHIEQQKDKSNLASFLREKNDLSSVLTESGDERYLVLICKLLNSVIVFDKINLEIVTAYKHHGNIIGCKVDKNHKTVELFSDCEPFELCINISLL